MSRAALNLVRAAPMTQPMSTATASVQDDGFGAALHAALSQRPRVISPKFFYDAPGSALFDRICELPEYYPTRTELALLAAKAGEIGQRIGADAEIVEFGAGSSRKIRLLLEALPRVRRFVPIDISAQHLHAAADALRAEWPGLEVEPIAADFTQPMKLSPTHPQAARRVGFFPGSSIGNFTPEEARSFLRQTTQWLRGGGLLIGVDLVKDPAVLHAAYNDAAGVTAAFNRNLLARANRDLGCDFDVAAFAHYAFYEPRRQRIEMHLISQRAQRVHLDGVGYDIAEGESLHTENSHKFTLDGFRALAAEAGYQPAAVWVDPQRWFSLHWLALPA